jgi:hypothetical protein
MRRAHSRDPLKLLGTSLQPISPIAIAWAAEHRGRRIGFAAEARALIPLIHARERNIWALLVYSSKAKKMSAADERVLRREAEAAGIKPAPSSQDWH